ncbi:MAG: hypothetical protein CM1200mP27_00710 [Chloroflexota bacterium]|nr:MAG: hypothetical protein CM1200mP27_00710 [Chloroflexota bacterium]
MSASETGLTALERNWGMVDRALEGLDDSVIAARPNDDSNSIGWLLFHKTRIADRLCTVGVRTRPNFGSKIAGTPNSDWMMIQIIPAGAGRKSRSLLGKCQQKGNVDWLLRSCQNRCRDYLGSLSLAEFERELTIPPRPTASIGALLGVLAFDNCVHGGQIAYLRGYYQGMGWFVFKPTGLLVEYF